MAKFTELPGFTTPITEIFEEKTHHLLSENAKKLLKGDLLALAWHNHTPRTEKLNVRDLNSIEEAFKNHSLFGNSKSPVVGNGVACCCCAPCCCCSAAAVTKVA